ncbi:pancreatic progenitor cell differentiation and proliferation factor isoform X2 [Bos taurus]|uniref:pancreatic progenitor cell differentiation and proliferation factor isoform X2 n=1 Tax=Bos taurus TaxID=9913 RepID=UPI000D534BAB|nr:pancreatic progenitor cell differentiation and proliferation factor isoform X2 [Bos taurus]
MAAIPSSGSLVATHDYYRRRLGSTSSNSSCGSAEYPGEAIPHHPASSSGSPLSRSWPQCWSPQSTRSLPRPPPARSHVTWLRKLWGSSSPAASLAKPTAGPRPE